MNEPDRQCRKCQESFTIRSGHPLNTACRKDGGHHDWFSPSAESIAELTERLHKADGMANEINILTKEIRELTAELKELREFVGVITSFHANEFGGKEMGDNVFIIVDGYGNELTTGTDPFDAWRKMNAGEGE